MKKFGNSTLMSNHQLALLSGLRPGRSTMSPGAKLMPYFHASVSDGVGVWAGFTHTEPE